MEKETTHAQELLPVRVLQELFLWEDRGRGDWIEIWGYFNWYPTFAFENQPRRQTWEGSLVTCHILTPRHRRRGR